MQQGAVAAEHNQNIHFRCNPVKVRFNVTFREPGDHLSPYLLYFLTFRTGDNARIADLHVPNSLERCVAASIAPMITPRKAPSSKTCRPVMVVPPGEVTFPLSTAGGSPVSRASLAEPYTVCSTSCSATGRGRPTSTPPSIMASIKVKIYPGPLPLNPVTTSN